MTIQSILEEKIGTLIQVCILQETQTKPQYIDVEPWEPGNAVIGCKFPSNDNTFPTTNVVVESVEECYGFEPHGHPQKWYVFGFTHMGEKMAIAIL